MIVDLSGLAAEDAPSDASIFDGDGHVVDAAEPTRDATPLPETDASPDGGSEVPLPAVVAGDAFTCSLQSSGKVHCWGQNGNGQLGDGSKNSRTVPKEIDGLSDAVRIAAGAAHVCVLRENGTVACWGANNNGQLGPDVQGDQTTPRPVPLITDVIGIGAGSGHTCVVHRNGTVTCWGANNYGQLGGTPNNGIVFGVKSISDAVTLGASSFNTCAVRKTGAIRCWGQADYGRLGTTSASHGEVYGVTDATAVAVSYATSCAIRSPGGAVVCWGVNWNGQLGNGTATHNNNAYTATPVTDLVQAATIAGGRGHLCVVTEDHGVKCWGNDEDGQVGIGTTKDQPLPYTIPNLNVVGVGGGLKHTCAVASSGAVWCWGNNDGGQLGDGTMVASNTPVSVVGL